MRIGMVLDRFYPEDIRITKEASALINGGYEVFLLCARNKNQKEFEEINGLKVCRMYRGFHKYVVVFWDCINTMNWKHPLFYSGIKRFIDEQGIDVLHIHDLPLVNTAILASEKTKIPVVADLHENYPEGIKAWFSMKTSPVVKLKNRIFFNYNKWQAYEKEMTRKADYIIAVVKEMKERLISDHNIEEEKITIIRNTESIEFIEKARPDINIINKYKNDFKIVYVGGFGPHRGLDTTIKALPYIKQTIPNVRLILVGSGSILSSLKMLATKYEVEDIVNFVGFQPFEKVFSYMKSADINIIPHNNTSQTNHALPHKFFQNLLVGKPVLVSDCDTLKRIMQEIDGGFIFRANDPKDLSEKVNYIFNHKAIAEIKSDNGIKCVSKGEYSWENTAENLVRFYNNIERKLNF